MGRTSPFTCLQIYLLGVNEPVTEYKAQIIGIAYREDDIEDKLVAATG